jgi:hypothetical protein
MKSVKRLSSKKKTQNLLILLGSPLGLYVTGTVLTPVHFKGDRFLHILSHPLYSMSKLQVTPISPRILSQFQDSQDSESDRLVMSLLTFLPVLLVPVLLPLIPYPCIKVLHCSDPGAVEVVARHHAVCLRHRLRRWQSWHGQMHVSCTLKR